MSLTKKIIFFVLFLSIIPTALAFGISSDYLENNILELTPGAFYEYQINLQNGAPVDMYVNLSVITGTDIASFNRTDTALFLPAKTYDFFIPLYLTIPPYAFEGKTYDVSYAVKPVDGKSEGVSFTIILSRGFTVKISKEGFIAKGIRAPKPKKYRDTLSDLTARVVMNLQVYKSRAAGAFIVFSTLFLLVFLLTKRGDIFSNAIFKTNTRPTSFTYTNLQELHALATQADETTLLNYVQTYQKELYHWLVSLTDQQHARAIVSSTTKKEFLQHLSNAHQ